MCKNELFIYTIFLTACMPICGCFQCIMYRIDLFFAAGGNVVVRLRETFDRYASNTGLLPRITFLKDIFGDGMPPRLAEVCCVIISSVHS